MAGVFSVNKAFLVVGFCVWNPTMLTTNPTTRVVRRRVVSSGYQGDLKNPTPLVASKIA
jgi:hypothetical protein